MTTEYQWVEWKSRRSNTVIAHAVDPDAVKRTGKRRALSGSLIPAHAVPAKPGTKKDHFDLTIIASRKKNGGKRGSTRIDTHGVWVGGKLARKMSELPHSPGTTLKPSQLKLTVGKKSWTVTRGGKRVAFGKL